MSGSRREAREQALGLLYEAETKGVSVREVLAESPVAPDPFVVDVVEGTESSRAEIDELIQKFAQDWTIDRMPSLDRHILRLATFELMQRPDVPVGAVISEAVELAREYSTDASSSFVNGVLASIAGEVRPPAN